MLEAMFPLQTKKKNPKSTRLKGASLVHIDFFFIPVCFSVSGHGFLLKKNIWFYIRHIKNTKNNENDRGDEEESSSLWGIVNM